MKRHAFVLAGLLALPAFDTTNAHAFVRNKQAQAGLPIVQEVAAQPLTAQARNLQDTLSYLGSPLPAATRAALNRAFQEADDAKRVTAIQEALDRHCLLAVQINPESRVKAAQGPAKPELAQGDWRLFLIKIHNQAGVTAPLRLRSPHQIAAKAPAARNRDRWVDMKVYDPRSWIHYRGNDPTLAPPTGLTGLEVEYKIVQIFSRDAGRRQAKIALDVGQGTQDPGFRSEADILFQCLPSANVTLRVRDADGKPVMGMFEFRDAQGRSYPAQAGRLAPDFFFHPQVYRKDGETVRLPAGTYTIVSGRGPEYRRKTQTLTLDGKPRALTFALERWIDPAERGWWSGDHHIHAAGCAHYTNPTAGVQAIDMMRHCLGEDLKVGCNLTWGPCFDYQKQFFTGQVDKVSQHPYLLRYDVEVSGFGSHQSGHLCLLRLKEQIYPGGDSYKHWPTLGLNTLRWAKKQGAVTGPAHSAFGLIVDSQELPNYIVPAFDGIGANEYIVDVTHEVPGPDGALVPAVDFISTVDTQHAAELNIWYHALNCGFRTRISGETDFPCITGERVGKGRSYVKLDGKLDFDSWCEGIRKGRAYVSDGLSHLMDFQANGQEVGTRNSELRLADAGNVRVTVKAAALLPEKAPAQKDMWYWNPEQARIGATREVPVEVIVNGYPVAKQNLTADGTLRDLAFDVKVERSSWIALRIRGASHTNPIFVLVGGKPIRASRRSADWCLKGVEQCWQQKQRFIRPEEMEDAKQAYEHARQTYRRILSESDTD